MIGIRFYSGQGLGNQLWVYAAARAIASYHQTSLKVFDEHCFKGGQFLSIDCEVDSEISSSDDSTKNKLDEKQVFKEQLFYDDQLKHFASAYDQRIEKIKGDTILEGLFQSEQYFYSGIDKLRHWVRLKEPYLRNSRQYGELCIINVRGGEYKRHKSLILPRSYWEAAIDRMQSEYGVKDFLIVTDDTAYASRLLPRYPVLKGSVADCYAALHGAGYLIVSNSSFSYFPIKTREDKPPVIAPFLWSRPSNKHMRWASPANVYQDWLWQSSDGTLVDYQTCLDVATKTVDYYLNEYNVQTTSERLLRSQKKLDIAPKKLKQLAKKVLSPLFPMSIG